MSDLGDHLARLGLSQYSEAFTAEGFDTWDTVLDITESDLSHLNVKLGHRRKLQRAIAESRGQSSGRPLSTALDRNASVEGLYRSEESGTESKSKQGEPFTGGVSGTATKRKYRRHPKTDEHAPERPPSAYVIFSNQVRESLKGQDLTFTEIAKIVGERWQVLPSDERESCERQANGAKERYYAALTEYKKTTQYEAYQRYLEDFKAKHAAPTKEGKRSKLETETSTSTRSSSHEQHEQAVNRRLSSTQPEIASVGFQRSAPSPPIGPARLPPGPLYSSKPTSPATRSLHVINSPGSGVGDQFSPISASPRSTTLRAEALFDQPINPMRDQKASIDTNLPYHSYVDSYQPSAPSTPPSYSYGAHYATPVERSSRRPIREATRLPLLTHEDTTLSSESGQSGHSGHNALSIGYSAPTLTTEPAKSSRILPQPVPNIGPPNPLLDRPPTLPLHPVSYSHLPSQPQSQDYRTQGPLAVLIRAGEIAAREADDENMEEDGA